mmetsp:Transcript_75026/g.132556  ORF Transcript_75026/g.132556 Transcript_75026/m.132556 type:complete len:240 (+) Transcript_75026:253-972(+)
MKRNPPHLPNPNGAQPTAPCVVTQLHCYHPCTLWWLQTSIRITVWYRLLQPLVDPMYQSLPIHSLLLDLTKQTAQPMGPEADCATTHYPVWQTQMLWSWPSGPSAMHQQCAWTRPTVPNGDHQRYCQHQTELCSERPLFHTLSPTQPQRCEVAIWLPLRGHAPLVSFCSYGQGRLSTFTSQGWCCLLLTRHPQEGPHSHHASYYRPGCGRGRRRKHRRDPTCVCHRRPQIQELHVYLCV